MRIDRATAAAAVLVLATTLGLATVLPTRGHFLADEARLYQAALEAAGTLRPAALGPMVSGTSPPLYVPGGAAIDVLALPFLFGTSPWLGSLFVLGLAGIGAWVFERALRRLGMPAEDRLFALALLCFSIWHARFADRLWNYHLFQLATPLLLWLAALCRQRPTSIAAALGLGLTGGIALQINPTGVLALAVALPIAAGTAGRRSGRLISGLVAGMAVAYLPYLVADAPHDFGLVRALIADRGARPAAEGNAWQSLLAFPAFASQSAWNAPWRPQPILAPVISFWMAAALTGAGLAVRSSLRGVCLLALALIPASFLLSGRVYNPQYAVALLPVCLLPSAAALGWLWRRGPAGSALALAYLAWFAGLGGVLLYREYLRPAVRPTIAAQLAVTEALLAQPGPLRWVDDSMFDEPGIYEALAQGRGRELRLEGPGPEAWLARPADAASLVVR